MLLQPMSKSRSRLHVGVYFCRSPDRYFTRQDPANLFTRRAGMTSSSSSMKSLMKNECIRGSSALNAIANAAKTRKSAAKRYRMTGSGKVVYMSSTKVHNLHKKSKRRKRRLIGMKKVRIANIKGVLKCMPAFRKRGNAVKSDRGPMGKKRD